MSLAEFRPSWQQVMIRVKDPKVSLRFYTEVLGFVMLKAFHFEQWKFSVYFVVVPEPGVVIPEEESERERLLFKWRGVAIELTHNHGTEMPEDTTRYHSGNEEGHLGFGHLGLHCDDVPSAVRELQAANVRVKSSPEELGGARAVVLDPDGYYLQLVQRSPHSPWRGKTRFSLAQTMLRVKDPRASLDFYVGKLGMKLVHEKRFDEQKFSVYFLQDATFEEKRGTEDGYTYVNACFHPCIELYHAHGTEDKPDFKYHSGNTDPRGFGHIGFLTESINDFFTRCKELGVAIKKTPADGAMRNLGFIYDPDGYWIEIIQRGITSNDFYDKK